MPTLRFRPFCLPFFRPLLRRSAISLLGTALFALPLLSACSPRTPTQKAAAIQAAANNLQTQLQQRQLAWGAPVFLRIFKEEKVLELWLQNSSGKFELFKSYPICAYSGNLGPKMKEGDQQAPEGFYAFNARHLNPNSSYHLSFNLNYPNAYDRAQGYTGSYLMVHGKCVSIGCYAMGDAQIEEIYALVEAALQNGQPFVRAHAFPFRLSEANLARHSGNRWEPFWRMMKPGFDYFETHHTPPNIDVINGQYQLNNPS